MHKTGLLKKHPLAAALSAIFFASVLPWSAMANPRTLTWYGDYRYVYFDGDQRGAWGAELPIIIAEGYYTLMANGQYDLSYRYDEGDRYTRFIPGGIYYQSQWNDYLTNPLGSGISLIPKNGDSLVFQGSDEFHGAYNDLTGLVVNGISFAENARGSSGIGGKAIVSTGSIINFSHAYQSIEMPITLGADQVWNGSPYSSLVSGMGVFGKISLANHSLTLENHLSVDTGDFDDDSSSSPLMLDDTSVLNILNSSSAVTHTITVGDMGAGNLNVYTQSQLETNTGILGHTTGSIGQVNVSNPNSTWTLDELFVGFSGEGILNISDGGSVESRKSISLGYNAQDSVISRSGTGQVVVDGAQSQLSTNGILTVGVSGKGTLNVQDGGKVISDSASLGAHGAGFANVIGANSQWENAENLTIGANSYGHLVIDQGGVVSSKSVSLGYEGNQGNPNYLGAIGEGEVKGNHSRLTIQSGLSVGVSGGGQLSIEDGGKVTSNSATLGYNVGGSGTVTVKDPIYQPFPSLNPSEWRIAKDLWIGVYGEGNLLIQDGGKAYSDTGVLAKYAGSVGIGEVKGIHSQLTIQSGLSVGDSGRGRLSIEAGGKVSSDSATLGYNVGGVGTVTVKDNPFPSLNSSEWSIAKDLWIGVYGKGNLLIQDGGKVYSDTGVLAKYAGSVGNVTVNGNDSQWQITDYYFGIDIGYAGNGTLVIENGGYVLSKGVLGSNVAYNVGSTGSATVTGANSSWRNRGSLEIGYKGNGTLNIEKGGRVNSDSLSSIGHFGIGTVTISDTDSAWEAVTLDIGFQGNGTLNIVNGGRVNSGFSWIGEYGIGVVSVSGTNSYMDAGALDIGNRGNGTLNIENGGGVYSKNSYIGEGSTGTGGVNIKGEKSFWSAKYLNIGSSGHGTLQIEDGGQLINSETYLASSATGVASAIVTGENSVWNSNSLTVGFLGSGDLYIKNGGYVTSNEGQIGVSNGSGKITVIGANSQWVNGNMLNVGKGGTGILDILAGGRVYSYTAYVGQDNGNGHVVVSGSDVSSGTNSHFISEYLVIGDQSTGVLDIEEGGRVEVGGTFSIGSWGTVNLNGGSLTASDATLLDGGRFNWRSGSLDIDSGSDFVLGENTGLGSFTSIGEGQTFAVKHNLKVNDTSLKLLGGQVKAETLLLNGSGGIRGNGVITANLAGDVSTNSIVASGGDLTLGNIDSGSGFDYAGQLNVGSQQVTLLDKDQANLGVSTEIADNGKLMTVNGLNLGNGETLSFSGNATILGGFTNNGQVSGVGGSLTFENQVNGAGSFGGNIRFHSAYNPGNSPASIDFNGGDVVFDADSILTMEILGRTPGSEYDQLLHIDHLDFNGNLVLAFGNGFTPFSGEVFDLFDFSSFTGNFDRISVTGIDRNLLDLSTLAVNGRFQVAAVPLPATAWQFLFGLFFLLVSSILPDSYSRHLRLSSTQST